VLALDPLHQIDVIAKDHFLDGSTSQVADLSIDSNKIADGKATAANNGVTSTVTVAWDSDALIGSNNARYSLDNKATWTSTLTVGSDYLSTFPVTRTSVKQTVIIQAKNALDGNYGDDITVDVDAYLSEGPSLTASYVPLTSTTGHIVWACTSGIVTVSIDGGTAATPSASPIAITLDGSTHSYLFEAVSGDQTISAPVAVPSLASSGGGGTFTSLSTAVHSTGAGTSSIRVTFAFSIAASFDVYTNDPGFTGDASGSVYVVAPSGSGVTSPFDAAVTEKLSPNPLGTASPVDIGFYVVAYSGVNQLGQSTRNVNTYQVDT
jgi:hypothetical protein